LRKKLVLHYILLLTALLFLTECAGVKPVTGSVRFAILGNSSPESPFSGFNNSLNPVLAEIQNRKPQIIIHTGNAIYGGNETDGILETDVRRQLNIFFPMIKKLHTAAYIIPGDNDYFNNSAAIFSEFSHKPACYSFNYGSIHFICLSPARVTPDMTGGIDIEWLQKDLEEYRDSNAIFVFIHRRLFPEKKKAKSPEKNKELHNLFLKYRVKCVFSGEGKDFTVKLKDAVKYVNAGCVISSNKKHSTNTYQFYIVNFINNDINIDPVKAGTEGNFIKDKKDVRRRKI
jgi:hypothetical protein